MSRQVAIYSLLDPGTSHIRYVGKSIDPKGRLKEHLSRSGLKIPCRATNWKKSLLNRGLKPDLGILEMVPEEIWQEKEKFWIKKLLDEGHDLTNTTPGGEGRSLLPGVKGAPWTEEHRRNSKAARIGLKPKQTPEGRAAHAAALRASWAQRRLLDPSAGNKWGHHTEETKLKIGLARKGTHPSESHLASMKAAGLRKRGKPLSESHRQKLCEGWIKRKQRALERGISPTYTPTLEQRQKISKRFKGKPLTAEHRAKLVQGALRRIRVPRTEQHKENLRKAWIIRKAKKENAGA